MSKIGHEALRLLDDLPGGQLNETNFGLQEQTWGVFFTAAGLNFINDATTTDVPTGSVQVDREAFASIFRLLSPDYRPLLRNLNSALAAWQKIRSEFARKGLQDRVRVWKLLTHVEHDPLVNIEVFIDAVDNYCQILKGMNHPVPDSEQVNILIGQLDASMTEATTALLTRDPIPTLDNVKDYLRIYSRAHSSSDSHPFPIKEEPKDEVLMANAARPGRFSRGTSGFNSDAAPSGGSVPPASNSNFSRGKGFRWCAAVHNDQCRRCGREGHIADRCVADMPQDIKDWVLNGPPRVRSAPAPYSAEASSAVQFANSVSVAGAQDISDDDGSDYSAANSADISDPEERAEFQRVAAAWKADTALAIAEGRPLPSVTKTY